MSMKHILYAGSEMANNARSGCACDTAGVERKATTQCLRDGDSVWPGIQTFPNITRDLGAQHIKEVLSTEGTVELRLEER